MTKFKVGDWWRTRGGEYRQILEVHRSFFLDDRGYVHNLDGSFVSFRNGEHEYDLVQKMKPPVWEEDND